MVSMETNNALKWFECRQGMTMIDDRCMEAEKVAIKALKAIARIKKACLSENLSGDLFEDEISEAVCDFEG